MDAQPYGNVIVDASAGGVTPGDLFGTAAIRRRVLDAWAASPARFREDANAEEDAARGAYHDRLVVELLQNAVDAAQAAGADCRVLITLTSGDTPGGHASGSYGPDSHGPGGHGPGGGEHRSRSGGMLEIANTGAALSAPGVESLSTLRASAKRDTAALGRFGVGFAAVLAVSDTPSIVSRSTAAPQSSATWDAGDAAGAPGGGFGVRWSKRETIDAVGGLGVPALDAELARRGGAVPVLRLPLPVLYAAAPPAGYDTVVRLPLRDADAAALARTLLAGLDPTLPLVMPGLTEVTIVIDGVRRTLSCTWADRAPDGVEIAVLDGRRWLGRVRRGMIPPALLADRPVEERARTGFETRAFVREGGWPADVPKLVRAPQPTDERLSLPVLASVGLPLEPSRRHTVAGPLRDWLVDRLAETVVDLAVDLGNGLLPPPDAQPAPPPASASAPVPTIPNAASAQARSLWDVLRAQEALDTQRPPADPAGPATSSPGTALDASRWQAALDAASAPAASLELVPTGLPVGDVDARLRDALARLLPDAPLLPGGRRGADCLVGDLGPATDPVTGLLTAASGDPAPAPEDPATVPASAGSTSPAGSRPPAREGLPRADREIADLERLLPAAADLPAGDGDRAGGSVGDAGGTVDGLLPAAYAARRWRPALDALGVRRLDTAGVVEILTELRRPPAWWARVYAALAHAPDRDALGALPVPLAAAPTAAALPTASAAPTLAADADADADTGAGVTGNADGSQELGVRMVTGPRGVLLPTSELDVVTLVASGLPLRVAHPDACAGAARDALRTLGAVEGTPAGVLRDGSVRDAIIDVDADADPDAALALAGAVLALVRDAGLGVASGLDGGAGSIVTFGDDNASGELSWLADLLLPDSDGDFTPAGELLIADSPLDQVLAADAPFRVLADDLARAWPAEVLEAVGVLRTFAVLSATDVRLDPDEPVLLDLDDSDLWVAEITAGSPPGAGPDPDVDGPGAPPTLRAFAAVRDLELVDPSQWPAALAELARPPLRDTIMKSGRLQWPDRPGRSRGAGAGAGIGPAADVGVSYTRWWLSRNALLPVAGSTAALPPPELTLPGADPLLAGLFAPAAPLPGVDADLLRRLGCRLTLSDVLGDPDAVLDLLDRLGDADRDVPWPAARALYMAAVDAVAALPRSGITSDGADGAYRDTDTDGETGDGDDDDDGPASIDPPLTVRTPDGVVRTSDAVIVDAPDLLPLLGAGRGALRLPLDRAAEASYVLGVPLLSSLGDCDVITTRDDHNTVIGAGEGDTPEELTAPDGTPYLSHTRLLVADVDGRPTPVPWRVLGGIGGEIHIDAGSGTDALARALAWHAGTWDRRHAIAEALRDPAREAQRQAEADLDDS
ncbi:sacsin N-terminal ATP-binding-like domain-containing protein [Frankia sp. CiP1_Cm_nod2]|uniref:sacsin N-terminal ATP-binding-like domain-containing protein n=1 Tax=Frankia sp. CiP1_Cm_nod2 TaxID=2897161 RepID=UPI002024A5BD